MTLNPKLLPPSETLDNVVVVVVVVLVMLVFSPTATRNLLTRNPKP